MNRTDGRSQLIASERVLLEQQRRNRGTAGQQPAVVERQQAVRAVDQAAKQTKFLGAPWIKDRRGGQG